MDDVTDSPPADARAAVRNLRRLLARLGRTWRGSLQLRVGVTTVLAASAMVIVMGLIVYNGVASAVRKQQRDGAIAQAAAGAQIAERSLAAFPIAGADSKALNAAFDQIRTSLTATGREAGLVAVDVLPNGKAADPGNDVPTRQDISSSVRAAVQQGNLVVQRATIHLPGRAPVHGLIVGELLPSGHYELYHLFDLYNQDHILDVVRLTVVLGGLGLILLVSALSLVVIRRVVKPVKVAAETAVRLASGDFARRIDVRGTDDIALLGRSFNDMAGSLQAQIRRLEDLSRLQQRFTSDVSHELRTPLTTIRMAAELLHAQRADFDPALARAVELLQTELDRFESLLADLLEISRYDAGAARLDAEQVDLRGVVGNAIETGRALAQHQQIELVVDMPATPVMVEADARRVERIIRNLVGNAIDHAEARPVVITVAADEQSAAVTVRDHGVGLRPGESALVFNRFWRGDPSRSRLTGGTGLGLAISLEDARLHGGWLEAWGETGLGAQFRLTLPRTLDQTLTSSALPLEPEALIDFDVQ